MGTSIRFAQYTVLHSSTESDRKLEDKHRECEHTDNFPILEILQNLVLRGIWTFMVSSLGKKHIKLVLI